MLISSGHRPVFVFVFVLCLVYFTAVAVTVALMETTPDESIYYYVGCYKERTDLLYASIYAKAPQTCVEFCEKENYTHAVLAGEKCYCTDVVLLAERQDDTLCNIRCAASRTHYCGGPDVLSYYSTSRLKQMAPNGLYVENATERSLTLVWDSYETRQYYVAGAKAIKRKQITNFVIKASLLQTHTTRTIYALPEYTIEGTDTSFEISELLPASVYNVSVVAWCEQTVCGHDNVTGSTEVAVPSPTPPEPKIVSRTDTTMTIELPLIKNDNGPVTALLIIVEQFDDTLIQPFDAQALGGWEKAQDDGLPYYITAELDYTQPEDNRAKEFVVGDGRRYGRYRNVPLEKSTTKYEKHIHIRLGVLSVWNGKNKTAYTNSSHDQHTTRLSDFTYATFEKGKTSVIALAIICIIFGICFVVSVVTYLYLRYKTGRQTSMSCRNTHEMTLQQPIIIEQENNGFVQEDAGAPPSLENFKQQFKELLNDLQAAQRLPRNLLRMNVNDVIAVGCYGEVVTGKLLSKDEQTAQLDCQLHVMCVDDLSNNDQAQLLREFRNLTKIQKHDNILCFYGISASPDCFYFVFEHETQTLKQRLIESRAPGERISTLSEVLVLQWIYEMASALSYLRTKHVLHKQLSSHNIYVAADAKLKLAIFGPIPYIAKDMKIELTRWLAPEVLRHQQYTLKSVVWAFGCVAWECCALGGTLYANITDNQLLLNDIKSGRRPACPAHVYHDMYQLLMNCWQLEPAERPDFEDVAFSVRQLMTSPLHALCFNRTAQLTVDSSGDGLPYYYPMLEAQN